MIAKMNGITALSVAAGMLALGGLAKADTIPYTLNIPLTSVPFTQPLTYNLFDSNLGLLTDVTLQLNTTSTANINIINPTGGPLNYTSAFSTIPLTVTGPPSSTTYISTTISGTTNVPGTVAANSSVSVPVSGSSDSGVVHVLPSSIWPGNWEFPGGGTDSTDLVFFSGTGSFGGSGDSGLGFGGGGSVQGTLTLIYTYTPNFTGGTPEPGALALFVASASVSVVGLRRRRARK